MPDRYSGHESGLNGVSDKTADLTPTNKSGKQFEPTKFVYVGTGGDLVVRLLNDATDRTYRNVPSGALLPIRIIAVMDTSTAADIVGHY